MKKFCLLLLIAQQAIATNDSHNSYLVSNSSLFHAFHTSIARVDYNAKEKTFEISIRVFTDDLERALGNDNAGKKFTVVNNDKNDAVVEKYIKKYFSVLDSQKKKKQYSYIGKEQEADATWIYVEVPCREGVSGLAIQNSVLHEIFDDQINVVNLNYLSNKKSYIFKKDEQMQALGI